MSGDGGLAYDRYQLAGRDEWLMRVGRPEARPVLFLAPLFEEMNRTRALVADAMRKLAAAGFCCWLPDLPGTGESERALETCSWSDWRDAARATGGQVAANGDGLIVASLRGGSLLDDAVDAAAYWRFAPAEGKSLARDLARSGLVGGGDAGGYAPSPELLAVLAGAAPAPVAPLRTVRLLTDPGAADAKLAGPALWRRSEPSNAPELAAAIATDIAEWAERCAAS